MINYGIFAQTAPAGGAGGAGGMAQILLMVGIFVIFYLVLILPESRRRSTSRSRPNSRLTLRGKALLSYQKGFLK